jgi:hypothetical protein
LAPAAFTLGECLLEDLGNRSGRVPRPGDQRAEAGDLVVLHSLGSGRKCSVEHFGIVGVAGDVVRPKDQSVYRIAG